MIKFCVVHLVCSPSYATGILNSVREIHFYVLCSEKLNYANYIEKCIPDEECTFKLLTEYNFKLDKKRIFS